MIPVGRIPCLHVSWREFSEMVPASGDQTSAPGRMRWRHSINAAAKRMLPREQYIAMEQERNVMLVPHAGPIAERLTWWGQEPDED